MKSRGDSLSMTLGTVLRSVVEGRVRKHGLTAPREATSRGWDRGLDLTRGGGRDRSVAGPIGRSLGVLWGGEARTRP